jgi:hypothetical protein
MKTGWLTATVLLFSLSLGFPSHQFAQNAPTQADNSQQAKRSLAVNFLRAINTAEMAYRNRHGSFASWHTVVSERFVQKSIAGQEIQPTFVHFADLQVPSGWNLRFNLTADGRGYDVLLEDKGDKEHAYAVSTDERGVVRECTAI